MANENLSAVWEPLKREAEAANERFAAGLESAWNDLASVLRKQIDAIARSRMYVPEKGKVASFRTLIEDYGQQLLADIVTSLRSIRAQQRALATLDVHGPFLDDLAGRLPQTIFGAFADLIDVLGVRSSVALRYRFGGRRKTRPVPLRRIVEFHFLEEANARASRQGECVLILAQASLLALSPWQDLRREVLRALAGQEMNVEALAHGHRRFVGHVDVLEKRAARVLTDLRLWQTRASDRLARSILRAKTPRSPRRAQKLSLWRQRCFEFWSRQQRAVTATLDLEWEFSRLTLAITDAAGRAMSALDDEHGQLLNELDSVIHWLQRELNGGPGAEFPAPSAKLASAEDQLADWEHVTATEVRACLPLTVESIEPRSSLPPRRAPWNTLEPQRSFLLGLDRFGREKILDGFREAEAGHHAIVREIERAREVVAFSREAGGAEGPQPTGIAREGLANALSLLSFQRENAADPHSNVEAKLAEGLAGALIFTHLTLEQRRLGVLTQLARQSGSTIAAGAAGLAAEKTSAIGAGVQDLFSAQFHRALRGIGWEAPIVMVAERVVARGSFDEILDLKAGANQLPMIYLRLFQLSPVEKPRFLVGRETEMVALARARSLWESGRAVSVIVAGARGSGKTSLLNCAATLECSAIPLAQPVGRIANARQMRHFLHELFQIPHDEDLVSVLLTRKTVVMLEEMERTFLRCMNGFEGLRELLSIVSATSRTTLWILSINQIAYGYLDAAVGLGEYFSHRINAMAVGRNDLNNAILMRHHLSGLRLQYPPVRKSDPRVGWLRQVLGLQHSAEEIFLDSLYVQSDGVFRSAFELWQQFIERVEGGVLYLREPLEPGYEPLIASLTLDDAFTLQATVQHGSITNEDHAAIFECPIEQSRIRLERLLSLELLEPEPAGDGFRVRPEAGRVVHIVLHRRNLV